MRTFSLSEYHSLQAKSNVFLTLLNHRLRRFVTMTQGTASGLLASLSSELAEVVEKVAPSVVRVDDGSRLTSSGILWSADGLSVTTSHGVERDDSLSIERADVTVHAATLLGSDPDTDIALL